MFLKFYNAHFIFQLTEMVNAIVRDVATLTFRFEHEQFSGVVRLFARGDRHFEG